MFRPESAEVTLVTAGRPAKAPLNVAIITFALGTRRTDLAGRVGMVRLRTLLPGGGEPGVGLSQSVGRVTGRERMMERVVWGQRHNRLTL